MHQFFKRMQQILFYRLKKSLPLPAMILIQCLPAVQLHWCYTESFADRSYGTGMNEIVGKHTQDEKERVRIVWDDGIGKDSMRVTAACADDPQDTKPMDYRPPAYEI